MSVGTGLWALGLAFTSSPKIPGTSRRQQYPFIEQHHLFFITISTGTCFMGLEVVCGQPGFQGNKSQGRTSHYHHPPPQPGQSVPIHPSQYSSCRAPTFCPFSPHKQKEGCLNGATGTSKACGVGTSEAMGEGTWVWPLGGTQLHPQRTPGYHQESPSIVLVFRDRRACPTRSLFPSTFPALP